MNNELKPQSAVQAAQTRAFVAGLQQGSQTYWDMVEIGDELSRDLHISPELVILYLDPVEDYNNQGWGLMIYRFLED